MTSKRPQSHLLAFSNFPLAYETLPKPSVSWTISLKTWISAFPTLPSLFLAVPPGTRPTHSRPLHSTPKLRHSSEPVEVRFPCSQNFLPGIPNLIHGIPASSRTCRRSSVLPPPKTVGQLRFLGMLDFYRRFLPRASSIQHPFHDVLSSPKLKVSHPITWTDTHHSIQRV